MKKYWTQWNYGFTDFNQDPLKNLFGTLRALEYHNTNSSNEASNGAYKTIIINNIYSIHSTCNKIEEDLTKGSLASYQQLFLF